MEADRWEQVRDQQTTREKEPGTKYKDREIQNKRCETSKQPEKNNQQEKDTNQTQNQNKAKPIYKQHVKIGGWPEMIEAQTVKHKHHRKSADST